MKTNIFLFCLLFYPAMFLAQTQEAETGYFDSPLKKDFVISGNFGEVRPNHFHSGIDIRTYYTGAPLYAVADGYVGRINISSGGYGNALYIIHSNGMTSVYAHMDTFADTLQNYIRNIQYKTRKFEQYIYPDAELFPVKKGDYIGTAGNSGYSFGPHLHFELRETKKDVPVNPLRYGYKMTDTTDPVIKGFAIYNLDEDICTHSKTTYKIRTKASTYKYPKTISVSQISGFAVQASDKINNVRTAQGPYKLELFLDGKPIFCSTNDKISFYESRYVNSFVDYSENRNKRHAYLKCFIEKGNKLSIYDTSIAVSQGVIRLSDFKKHELKIVASDIYKNKQTVYLSIRNTKKKYEPEVCEHKLYCDSDNFYVEDDLRLIFPKGSLYTNLCFDVSAQKAPASAYLFSPLYTLGNESVPVNDAVTLSISAKNIPQKLIDKAVIVRQIDAENFVSAGGDYIHGFISTGIRRFGTYGLTVDAVAPEISAYKTDFENIGQEIQFTITDNLSDIDRYTAFIDNEFVLFDYDKKNDLLTYRLDPKFNQNTMHTFLLSVFDEKNNEARFETTFFK